MKSYLKILYFLIKTQSIAKFMSIKYMRTLELHNIIHIQVYCNTYYAGRRYYKLDFHV